MTKIYAVGWLGDNDVVEETLHQFDARTKAVDFAKSQAGKTPGARLIILESAETYWGVVEVHDDLPRVVPL